MNKNSMGLGQGAGMAIGLALGAALCVAMHNWLLVAVGVLIGLAIDAVFRQKSGAHQD